MQSTSGKRRSCKRVRKSRISAFACFSLVFLYSCSSSIKQGPVVSLKGLETQNKIAKKVCLKSIGKGRIVFGKSSNRFTYESTHDSDWFRLGIDIPFKGQEDLLFPLSSTAKMGGSIYSKMRKSFKHKQNSLRLLDKFLHESSLVFRAISQGEIKSCQDGLCLKGKFEEIDGYPRYTTGLGESRFLRILFKREKNNMFTAIQLSAFGATPKGPKKYLGMDLAITKCQ